MGCVASRLEEEEEVVSICRERKRLIKLAVERRYALADAHCRYSHSLYAVSAAIKLFVARHSNAYSPFLITLPPQETLTPPPMFLQQNPTQPTTTTQEAIPSSSCSSPSSSEDNVTENPNVDKRHGDGYFYMGMSMGSPQREFGWDFFNPFVGEEVIGGGFRPNSDDDLRAVRAEEGIPELEDAESEKEKGKKEVNVTVEENKVGSGRAAAEEEKGLTVIDEPARVTAGDGGRELLDALSDIEDHFIRAYDSGKEVSRMLEANKMHMQSGLEDIKENSTKLIQAITWHRSSTYRSSSSSSSSCKSLLAASTSKNSNSTTSWTEYKNDLFDDYGGMAAGSHSLTLGRLYAWEKKLYDEVKAGDEIRKLYERKCAHLRSKDVRGEDTLSVDKTRAAVRDLYSRILVAIRRAESISEKIQKLTDEELQPQIIELLQGLTQTWKIMMEAHETQEHIIVQVKTFDCPTYGKFCNDSHRLATLQLEAEIQNWRECFTEYVAAQRSYVESLHGWLSKFLVPEIEFGSRGRRRGLTPPSYGSNGPPLYVMCHDWLTGMEKLPDKAVCVAMKSFARNVRALLVQQGEEQDQKRKVDKMAKEVEKKTIAYQKAEGRVHETKLLEYKKPSSDEHDDAQSQPQADYLSEKKDALDNLRRRLEVEKEKHHNYMQQTQRIALNGFQTGFSLIFDAMLHFSKGSLRMYNELLLNNTQNFDKGTLMEEEGGSEDLKQHQLSS